MAEGCAMAEGGRSRTQADVISLLQLEVTGRRHHVLEEEEPPTRRVEQLGTRLKGGAEGGVRLACAAEKIGNRREDLLEGVERFTEIEKELRRGEREARLGVVGGDEVHEAGVAEAEKVHRVVKGDEGDFRVRWEGGCDMAHRGGDGGEEASRHRRE